MIDGAEHFHYLGLARRGKGVMLVFQEGLLFLDQTRPGWGAMRPSDLAKLMPPPTPPSSGSTSDSEDRHGPEVPLFDDSLSDDLKSTSTSASASGSPRSSAPGSHSTSSDDDDTPPPPGWSPPRWVLGWHPSEALVWVGAVTANAAQAYRGLNSTQERQAFAAQLKSGHWAPQLAGHPGQATMVAMQMFGELIVMVWESIWHAANSGAHQQTGLTQAHACQMAAYSVVAEVCSLAPVLHAELSEYHGHIEAEKTSILIFDRGLLVQAHPDPKLVGWHPFGEIGRCAIVSPESARAMQWLCDRNMPLENSMFLLFFMGELDEPDGHGPFVAVTWSHKLQRPLCLRLDAPGDLCAPWDPHGPAQPEVELALRQARPALVHNRHDVRGPLGLASGAWQVPLFTGVIQCIDTCVHVPGLLVTTWHDTLQPVIEHQLLNHRKQEGAWLTSGVIQQPIDHLVDLMRRDIGLRRTEVWVMWPVELLADLFKTLAPTHPAQVIHAPKAADVDAALKQRACVLMVFQTPGEPEQSVVLVQGNRCWSELERFDLDELRVRVNASMGNAAREHLVALAFLV